MHPPIRLMPLRPRPLIPVLRPTSTALAAPNHPVLFVLGAEEIPKRRREHGRDLARIQLRNQRHFRVGVGVRRLVVGMQERHTGSDDELRARQVRGELAEMLDGERVRQGLADVREADFLLGLAACGLEGCLFDGIGPSYIFSS